MINADFPQKDDPHRGDIALDLTSGERTKKTIFAILQQMDEEKSQSGSYYDLIPAVLRPFVDKLIDKHYPDHAEKFNQDRNAFKEKMSQNWVAKFRAFPVLAKDSGFVNLINMNGDIPPQFISDSLVACLTASSSYVLIGPNSLDRKGAGAHLDYVRLPLREELTIENTFLDSGAYFDGLPKILKPLHIVGATDLRTSPALAIWEKPMISPTDRNDFNKTMFTGNQTINAETGFV